ncbi:MAG: response regulator [Hyphomicrobium sp.]
MISDSHHGRSVTRPTVLIADDDPFSRAMAASRLAALDANVVEAENGEIAMTLLQESKIDLAIVDLEMPIIDGFMLLGCIRGHPRLRHIPVVVLTGREDREAMAEALSRGATSFLQKPLNWTAFGQHIAHLIELSSGAAVRTVTTPARPRLSALRS